MHSRSDRFVFRIRLQTILVLVAAISLPLGLVTNELHREHRKKRDAAMVVRLGGRVDYNLRPENKQTSVVNGYLRVILGDEYFTEVDGIYLVPQTAADLGLLRSFPETKRLSLVGSAASDDALERLGGLKQLDTLKLDGVTLSDRGLKSLTKFPNLHYLQFGHCSLQDQSLKSLSELRSLNYLEFENCSISNASLKSLTQLPNLTLDFRSCSLTDANLGSMHGAQTLVRLVLFMNKVTEAGLLAIRQANPTWSLSYSTAGSSNANYLPSVQELPQIDKLTFQGSLTSDATLAVLKNARSLTSLRFEKCCLTDHGLQTLPTLQNLRSLTIIGTSITDEGIRAFEELTKLQFLSLSETKIEGLGLGALPPSITTLALTFSQVTDREVAEIAKLTALKELDLRNTVVSDSGLAQLQRALPKCVIFTK